MAQPVGIGTANAINDVLCRLLAQTWPGAENATLPDDGRVVEAVEYLARLAHGRIGSGWTPEAAAAAARRMLADPYEPTADDRALELGAAMALVRLADGERLYIAPGLSYTPPARVEEWAADASDDPEHPEHLVLTHPSGRRVLLEVCTYGLAQARP